MATSKAAGNGVKVTPGRPAPAKKKIFPPLPPPEEDNAAEDDFLKFWTEFRADQKPATTTILGVEVVVPTDVPLSFDDVEQRMAASNAETESEEAQALFAEMCAVLFGENTLALWKEKGVTVLQIRVLTTWGLMNARTGPTTFQEAAETVQQAIKAEAEGKLPGPNRATRRENARKAASSPTRASGTTGQRSKRTSPANTASKPAT